MDGFSIFLAVFSPLLLLWALRVVSSFWLKPRKLEQQLKQQGIKGSSYRVFFGDLKQLGSVTKEAWSKPIDLNHQIVPRVVPFIYQTVEKHGKISMFWMGAAPRVIIRDPELMRSIMQYKSEHIQKPPLNPLANLLAKGVSTLEGEDWFHRRRMMNPAFLMEKLKGMIPAFASSAVELIRKWGTIAGPQGTCDVDVWPEFQIFAGDVISRAAFGSNYEEGKRIFEFQKEQVELVLEAAYSVYLPGFRFVPTKKNRRRNYLDREIKRILRNLIRKKEEAMRTGLEDDNLLGLLLQSASEEDDPQNRRPKHQIGLTIEDVIEECKLFYFAGQETTAVWLTWTMILLAMNPTWQEEARKEVKEVCGKAQPDFESINRLKIVTMILYEVLRLYPPVAGLFRYTHKGIKLGDLSFPDGVEFFLPILMIHHDTHFWGEDAEEFNPGRFSEGVAKASKTPNVFFPFGWGPRMCLGQNFAVIEAKMALAMILQHFSFELSKSYVHAPISLITLQPQHGAQVVIRKL